MGQCCLQPFAGNSVVSRMLCLWAKNGQGDVLLSVMHTYLLFFVFEASSGLYAPLERYGRGEIIMRELSPPIGPTRKMYEDQVSMAEGKGVAPLHNLREIMEFTGQELDALIEEINKLEEGLRPVLRDSQLAEAPDDRMSVETELSKRMTSFFHRLRLARRLVNDLLVRVDL